MNSVLELLRRSGRQLRANAFGVCAHFFTAYTRKRSVPNRELLVYFRQHQDVTLFDERMSAVLHHVQRRAIPRSSASGTSAKCLVRRPYKKRGTMRRHIHPAVNDNYALQVKDHQFVVGASVDNTTLPGHGGFFLCANREPKKLTKEAAAL